MAKVEPTFELNDTIMERIVFAMEDQTKSRLVDLRTGELVAVSEAPPEDYFAPPPAWTPADGFRLMEGFCARLKNIELKHALLKALSHGKGVFKAFRQVLSEYSEEDARYREYKNSFLKLYIESWMDDMRESLGLARLGPEPEEYEELVDEEFQVESTSFSELDFDLPALVEEACSESTAWLPAAAALLEKAETLEFLEENSEVELRYIAGTEGKPIAAAAGAVKTTDGRPLGLVRFLYVSKDFRSLGLELRLLNSMEAWCSANGIEHCLIRSLFLRPELNDQLAARGLKVLGSQFLLT